MKIYSEYLAKHCIYRPFIPEPPNPIVGNIIVIPAIGEPDLIKTILSLKECDKPITPVEVIVVLNSSENSSSQTIEQNLESKKELEEWAIKYNCPDLKVHCVFVRDIPNKIAGAGNARKIGMDEAIYRFLQAGNASGIITSLDADAIVADNYLVEIEKMFTENSKTNGCSIYFEHPLSGNQFSSKVYETITDYELHLRYYKQALKYTGFPYFHHTVGSAFAVRATTYCKQGGMNRKQAGEDFYFLHKIMPLGNFQDLNSSCVYPSSRPSDRVPFGTGATIRQFAIEEEKEFLTYNFNSFKPLKELFAKKENFFKIKPDKIISSIGNFDEVLRLFLLENKFNDAIIEINANSGKVNTFNHRFFTWFDAFRLIKYLNFAHNGYFSKQNVISCASDLLLATEPTISRDLDALSMLITYRKMERDY